MKVMNPGLPYLVRKALHKQILDKAKKITVCPHCRELNGTVKKCGLLKIVHEKYRSKKATDPMVTDALGELYFSCFHSFIHLFHIPLILYRCGTSHVYI